MGCGSSTGAKGDVLLADSAVAVQPAAGGSGAEANGSPRHAADPLAALGATVTGNNEEADPHAIAALQELHRSAGLLLSPDPSLSTAATLDFPGGSLALDAIAGSYVTAAELGLLVEYISDSDACTLFSEAKATALEITPQALAEIILVAGGADDAVRMLKRLNARRTKCASMAELQPAVAALQAEECAMLARAALPADVATAVIAAREFLSRPSCELYPYAIVPRMPAPAAASADDAAASIDHHEDLELDFGQLNQLLVQTRTRGNFLAPTFLVQLVHASGRGPRGQPVVLDVLNGLALQERSFEMPSALLRAALGLRGAALAAQQTLRSKAVASDSAAPGAVDPLSASTVPEPLAQQVPALVSSLSAVEPSCVSLAPLLAPLIPTLSALTPPLRHLQAYLSRFLPLLQESVGAARGAGLSPEADAPSAQILRAYLLPFFRQTQPWIVQLRPYLAGLQPFFDALQPNLVLTHAAFAQLQPFLAQLAPYVGVEADEKKDASSSSPPPLVQSVQAAPFLLVGSPAFTSALELVLRVLALLHPLLRQLHPLTQGLLDFCAELSVFLAQLQQLLELLAAYQTLPLEPEPAPAAAASEEDDEQELSSIARPWFPAESDPTDVAEAGAPNGDAQLSAPQFLARHGRFLGRLVPYVTQLRPFAGEVHAFVQKFSPFLAQLAPFYATHLKRVVTPAMIVALPTRFSASPASQETQPAAEAEVVEASAPASAAAGAAPPTAAAAEPEMDEATLQRLLSS